MTSMARTILLALLTLCWLMPLDAIAQQKRELTGIYAGPIIGFTHTAVKGTKKTQDNQYRAGGVLGIGYVIDHRVYIGLEITGLHDGVSFKPFEGNQDQLLAQVKMTSRYTIGGEVQLGTLITSHIMSYIGFGWQRTEAKFEQGSLTSKEKFDSFSGSVGLTYHTSKNVISRVAYNYNTGAKGKISDILPIPIQHEQSHSLTMGLFYLF